MKIMDWFYRNNRNHATKSLMFTALAAFLLMSSNIVWLNSSTGFNLFDMLDMKLYVSSTTLYDAVASMSESALIGYLNIHLVDYVFILSFYPWLIMMMTRNLQRNSKQEFFLILVVVAMMSDLMENIFIDVELVGSLPTILASILGLLTMLKFASMLMSVGVILYLGNRQKHQKTSITE